LLSVIVPTHNREDGLKRLAKSLDRHTNSYELLIEPGEDGYAVKLNRGIQRALGDYLTFLHDDSEVTVGWAEVVSDCGALCWGDYGNRIDVWGGLYDGISPGWLAYQRERRPLYVQAGIFSRETIERVFPFDGTYTRTAPFDIDLGFALAHIGLRYATLPGKVIHWAHQEGLTWGLASRVEFCYLRSKWKLEEYPYWWEHGSCPGEPND
jgi:glycosyltransferase involved in cell wall biosynthesis